MILCRSDQPVYLRSWIYPLEYSLHVYLAARSFSSSLSLRTRFWVKHRLLGRSTEANRRVSEFRGDESYYAASADAIPVWSLPLKIRWKLRPLKLRLRFCTNVVNKTTAMDYTITTHAVIMSNYASYRFVDINRKREEAQASTVGKILSQTVFLFAFARMQF